MTVPWNESELFKVLVLLGITLLVYLFVRQIGRPLRPSFATLEFAATPVSAKRALLTWEEAGTKSRALWMIGFESFLLIPLYVITAFTLADAAETAKIPGGSGDVWVLAAVFLAALLNYAENVCLTLTLMSKARESLVFVTRWLAWSKSTILALTVVYTFIRVEMYLDARLGQQGWQYTLPVLVVATLIMAFVVGRRLTALSASYPPLLALQLAPSRLAAKDVLERWGDKGRKFAQRTLLLQAAFAILYGLTLAGMCDLVNVKVPLLQNLAGYLSWFMLIAGGCHVGQNLGAYMALRLRGMGWWVDVMRRLGWARMTIHSLAGGYFVVLLLRREWHVVKWIGVRIAEVAPEIRLPWS